MLYDFLKGTQEAVQEINLQISLGDVIENFKGQSEDEDKVNRFIYD